MTTPILIDSMDDPRIAPYVSIREKDLTGHTDGRFIVEGKVTLNILLTRSTFELDSVFLSQSRLQPLADILPKVPANVPIYTASQAIMDKIVGFPIHRGILACARKGAPRALGEIANSQTLLVLNETSHHDNVGAAFRNAAAFGAGGVILDERSCDPLYRKAIRVSAGSSLWLPFHHGGTGADHIELLKDRGYEIWALTPRRDAAPLQDMAIPDRLAIMLGAEGPGLPTALIDNAQPVRIPMISGFDSVNVATAGAIALSHVFARRQDSPSRPIS